MKINVIKVSALLSLLLCFNSAIGVAANQSFAPNVDLATGAIHVPENYTRWATLGTWAHANTELKPTTEYPDGSPGSVEFHVVYTQPETIDFYKKNNRFPDGAVLVKKLIEVETMSMTKGPAVSHATKIKG